MAKVNWESFLEFANTDLQKSAVSAMVKEGTQRKAAEALGISRGGLRSHLEQVEKLAARRGYAPHHEHNQTIPEGYTMRGSSTLYDENGEKRLQWIKTDQDKAQELELAKLIYADLSKGIKRLPPIKEPKQVDKDLLNLYPVTDAHIGMMAWHLEGGADWDLSIAEEVVIDAFRRMVARSDAAERCIIGQLGDFLHFDGLLPETPRNRHVLDADGRYPKVVKTANRILRTIIDDALRKHRFVHVILAEGNHDESSTVWMREMYESLYEKEPRVTIDPGVSPYYAVTHGSTMLGFHHGHLKTDKALPGFFAAEHARMWGETTYRYAHTGHRHCDAVTADETGGMLVTRHPTLAARDAHASRHGYSSQRNVSSHTYHREYGKWSGVTVVPKR